MHVWFPVIISCSSWGYDYGDELCSGPGTLSGLEKLESNKTYPQHTTLQSAKWATYARQEATEMGPLSCEVLGVLIKHLRAHRFLSLTVDWGQGTQPCWEAICLYLKTDICCIVYVGRGGGGGRSLVETGYSRQSNLWQLPHTSTQILLFWSILSFQIAIITFSGVQHNLPIYCVYCLLSI